MRLDINIIDGCLDPANVHHFAVGSTSILEFSLLSLFTSPDIE